jgi:hypothetical protein
MEAACTSETSASSPTTARCNSPRTELTSVTNHRDSAGLDGRGVGVQDPVGTGDLPPGREADHSLPTSAEVKNTWIYTSTPQYAFMA